MTDTPRTYTQEEVDALIAAAYEAAGDIAVNAEGIDLGILALTSDDARAALEKMLAEARKEGMLRAHDALVVVPAASREQEQAIQMCQAAIRAEEGET